jgi:tRNA synthetases class II (D, K and N)
VAAGGEKRVDPFSPILRRQDKSRRGRARAGDREIIGASQREERLEIPGKQMAEHGIDQEHYAWYRDLRRYGDSPSASGRDYRFI